MSKGWTTKPTAKSIKARLEGKMCPGSGKCSKGVLQMAVKTTAFPKSDATHIGTLIAQTKKTHERFCYCCVVGFVKFPAEFAEIHVRHHSEFAIRSTKIPRENSTSEDRDFPLWFDSQDATDNREFNNLSGLKYLFQFVAKVRSVVFFSFK